MISSSRIGVVLCLVWIVAACLCETAAAQGTILLQTRFPVQHESTRILVQTQSGNPVSGAKLIATYRPGSRVQEDSEVGITDAHGAVDWIPIEAGIVSISTEFIGEDSTAVQLQTNISVKFASTPFSGVLIMLFAGILLIGGSIIRFTRYIRGAGF
ncbi:MAG: hypothetical protein ABIA59_02815 [Candidatus Latescibacterota bacterium]